MLHQNQSRTFFNYFIGHRIKIKLGFPMIKVMWISDPVDGQANRLSHSIDSVYMHIKNIYLLLICKYIYCEKSQDRSVLLLK